MGVSTQEDKAYTVAEAKARLRSASSSFDPYSFIKSKPLHSVGAAFLIGLGWNKLWKSRFSPSLLALSVEMLKRV